MGECVYCGEWRELTHDHVPPRSLFSKPRPSDLITVPSCRPCNGGASKDDEYFRLMIQLGIDRERFPKENSNSVDAINKLAKPQRLRFASYLLDRYRPNPSRFEVARVRVGSVLCRIARGLFYHHTAMRLPENVPFQFVSIGDQPRVAAALSGEIDSLAKSMQAIGGGVFRYGFAQGAPPDPFVTEWLVSFYDHRKFFCVTSP